MPEGGHIPEVTLGDIDLGTILGLIGAGATVFQLASSALNVAHDQGWLNKPIGRWLSKREALRVSHAEKCRKKTGYIGALVATNTVYITASVLFINLLFNILSLIRNYPPMRIYVDVASSLIIPSVVFFAGFALVRMVFVFQVCRLVLKFFHENDEQ